MGGVVLELISVQIFRWLCLTAWTPSICPPSFRPVGVESKSSGGSRRHMLHACGAIPGIAVAQKLRVRADGTLERRNASESEHVAGCNCVREAARDFQVM